MQYIELKDGLKDFSVFSLSDIRKLGVRFHRRRLNEWQNKGYVVKVIKGYYIFSDLELNEKTLFEIANTIYNPSYISFEMALSFYGFIPESVYGITSASTRRTYTFKTKIGQFSYRTIAPRLFFGYKLIQSGKRYIKIAAAEKAVLDYFYINPHIKDKDDFLSLRINRERFLKAIDKKIMNLYLKKFARKTLTKRIQSFLEFMRYA